MTVLKIQKTQKLPQNTKNQKFKNSKKSCKEISNEKVQKTNYSYNSNILRMTFLKISQTYK